MRLCRAEKLLIICCLSFIRTGGRKRNFFTRFGFVSENWEVFADALKLHAAEHEVNKNEASPFGMRYIVEGEIRTPDKRHPQVRVVWFIEANTNLPYLVTAYPSKK